MELIFNKKSKKWRKVNNIQDWIKRIENSKNNEEGRSALSLAKFCSDSSVEDKFKEILRPIFHQQDFILKTAQPEKSSRFDNYGKPRMHDLAICGETLTDKMSIFVGVEAKVNETYGSPLADVYNKAKQDKLNGKSTNRADRIENLICNYFNDCPQLTTDSTVRYQLLYAIAGTLCEQRDYNILLLLTFKTEKYDLSKANRNKKDLMDILSLIEYEILLDGYYKCKIGGKVLYIVEKSIEL